MMPSTLLAKISFGAKILQLVLACACIALYEESYKVPFNLLLPITFGGYIIICGVLIAGMFLQHRAPRLLDMAFSIVGMVLFLAAGALALEYHTKQYYKLHAGLAMGSLAIINSCAFLADIILTYKDVHEYNPQQ